jgi:hypothetical protein
MTTYIMQQIRTTQIEGMLDTIPSTTHKAIFVGSILPEAYQSLNKFILIYRVTPRTADDIQVITYRVNCRQILESDAEKLAALVYDRLNRVFGDKVYSKCMIQPPIPEGENLFNVVVDVEIKNA